MNTELKSHFVIVGIGKQAEKTLLAMKGTIHDSSKRISIQTNTQEAATDPNLEYHLLSFDDVSRTSNEPFKALTSQLHADYVLLIASYASSTDINLSKHFANYLIDQKVKGLCLIEEPHPNDTNRAAYETALLAIQKTNMPLLILPVINESRQDDRITKPVQIAKSIASFIYHSNFFSVDTYDLASQLAKGSISYHAMMEYDFVDDTEQLCLLIRHAIQQIKKQFQEQGLDVEESPKLLIILIASETLTQKEIAFIGKYLNENDDAEQDTIFGVSFDKGLKETRMLHVFAVKNA